MPTYTGDCTTPCPSSPLYCSLSSQSLTKSLKISLVNIFQATILWLLGGRKRRKAEAIGIFLLLLCLLSRKEAALTGDWGMNARFPDKKRGRSPKLILFINQFTPWASERWCKNHLIQFQLNFLCTFTQEVTWEPQNAWLQSERSF